MSLEINKGKDFIYIIPVVVLIIFLYLMAYKEGDLNKENVKKVIKESGVVETKEKVENKMEKNKIYKTDSGLSYEIIKLGNGPKPICNEERCDTVEVHYEGTLEDGTIFDSSYARGEKISFPLNQVIAGWTEGLQLMPVGSKFKFIIPPNLAYGDHALPGIPANSTLIFTVELFDIKN